MRLVAQINRGHPARMAPIFLHRQRLSERVHGIEDDQVCFVEEIHEDLLSLQIVHLIFAISRIDDTATVPFETVPDVPVAGVAPPPSPCDHLRIGLLLPGRRQGRRTGNP